MIYIYILYAVYIHKYKHSRYMYIYIYNHPQLTVCNSLGCSTVQRLDDLRPAVLSRHGIAAVNLCTTGLLQRGHENNTSRVKSQCRVALEDKHVISSSAGYKKLQRIPKLSMSPLDCRMSACDRNSSLPTHGRGTPSDS